VPAQGAARPARVRVPASTSNLGAGFDCLGLALDFYLEASFMPGNGQLRSERTGSLAGLAGEDLLVECFRQGLGERGIDAGGVVNATSEIPIGRGLGSSASATVAGLALAAVAAGESLEPLGLLGPAVAREGHPDNAAPALFGGFVGVVPDDSDLVVIRLPLSPDIAFAWAAPARQVGTREAREALPAAVPHGVATRALSRTVALVQGMAVGDAALIRSGFSDELHVPHRLPLIPGGVDAMRAAEAAGAWAVTISGSGSGLIAACPRGTEAAVAEAMAAAFRATAADPAARSGIIARPVYPDMSGLQVLSP